jgi:hypothetical protein
MELNRIDFAITLLLWLFLLNYIYGDMFLRQEMPFMAKGADIFSFLGGFAIGIFLSSPALVFYLNKNRPTYRNSFLLGILVAFIGYIVVSAVFLILDGFLFVVLIALVMFAIAALKITFVMNLVGKFFGNPKLSMILIAFIAVLAFALNLHWIFIFWGAIGLLISIMLGFCALFWNAAVRLIPRL